MISEVECIDRMKYLSKFPDKFFDLIVDDPPYQGNDAIDISDNKKKNKQATKRTSYHLFDNIMPDEDYFAELKRVSKHQIIWGGNYFGLAGGVIVWQKNGTAFGEGEIAICSTHKSVRFFEFTWNGMIQGDMKNKEKRINSCQKPIKLYKWVLNNYAKIGDKIGSFHLGSQSDRIACYEMGFDFWGCELDPIIFADGNKRFENAIKQTSLFTFQEQTEPEQIKLF